MKQALFTYITIAFTAPVAFLCCTNDRDGYSHHLIFFTAALSFGKLIFSTQPTGFFDIRAHIEYWRP